MFTMIAVCLLVILPILTCPEAHAQQAVIQIADDTHSGTLLPGIPLAFRGPQPSSEGSFVTPSPEPVLNSEASSLAVEQISIASKSRSDFDSARDYDVSRKVVSFFSYPQSAAIREITTPLAGLPSPVPLVMIYEGMSLSIFDNDQKNENADGEYVLNAVMETQATVVDLRLQLRLWEVMDDRQKPGSKRYEYLGAVTIPPIRFEPTSEQLDKGQTLQWNVRQSGYSPLLMKSFLEVQNKDSSYIVMERIGYVEAGRYLSGDGIE